MDKIMRESFEKVRRELLARVNRQCDSDLNSKNLFKAINEHAIYLVNYHIGLQQLEAADFLKLDHEIRQTLIKHKVHLKLGCKERLYLPRTEMERGLHSVEMKSEYMLFHLLDTLKKYKNISSRRAAILKVEEQNKTQLSLIYQYLGLKYSLTNDSAKNLLNAQRKLFYDEINKKKFHEKLYRARSNELVSLKDSSTWMKYGNIDPRAKGIHCYIQDRNVFWRDDALRC
ncbi:hypothetical protein TCON_1611 [Astathelohania contejeani]|uniref:Uncharacterized protein n=1 Tax=Astathelohania contejeani TaxID=164912 RepID=A0ABQ7HYC4_9MICR|nr:hypothetical protein TCON_1611 [Thelohania contejeani]